MTAAPSLAPRPRHLLAGVLTAGVLASGFVVGTAPAADAASGASFCFVWSDGKAYAHKPVFLVHRSHGHNTRLRTGTTDAAGCGLFRNLPTGKTLFVRAATMTEKPGFIYWWSGRTPKSTAPGGGRVDLGTGTVRAVRGIGCASTDPHSGCVGPGSG